MRAGPQQQHANGQATCQTHQDDEPRMEPAHGVAGARLGRWEGPPGRLGTTFSELTSCALSWQWRIRRSAIVGWRRCPGAVHGVDSDLRPRHLADTAQCPDATGAASPPTSRGPHPLLRRHGAPTLQMPLRHSRYATDARTRQCPGSITRARALCTLSDPSGSMLNQMLTGQPITPGRMSAKSGRAMTLPPVMFILEQPPAGLK